MQRVSTYVAGTAETLSYARIKNGPVEPLPRHRQRRAHQHSMRLEVEYA
jgi:hypothetical protein